MSKPDDIYNRDQFPRVAKRKMGRKVSQGQSNPTPTTYDDNLPPHLSNLNRRKRQRGNLSRKKSNKVGLWITVILGLVLLVYGVILMLTVPGRFKNKETTEGAEFPESDPNPVVKIATNKTDLGLKARAHMKQGKMEEAIESLERIVNLDRHNVAAQNDLGVAYLAVKKYLRAEKLFKNILLLDHGTATTYYNLTICYSLQRKISDAIEMLEKAADQFGVTLVATWVKHESFDPIRTDVRFKTFTRDILGIEALEVERRPSLEREEIDVPPEERTRNPRGIFNP